MNIIFGLLAAFGGGALGAVMGALPSFILMGVIAVGGSIVALAGAADVTINNVAFGSFLGPHIAFAGAIAAVAFCANQKHAIASGKAVREPLDSTKDPSLLCVGGIFGVLGYLLHYLFTNILLLPTNTVMMSLFLSCILSRLLFGTSGLFGTATGKRVWLSPNRVFIYNLLLGACIGLVCGGVGIYIMNLTPENADLVKNYYPILCFGISALSLIFNEFGKTMPITHHITYCASTAAVLSDNLVVGVLIAILCSLLGDFFEHLFNSNNTNTHIDTPAATIFLVFFLIQFLWKA